ncbi:MAG: 4Fe-4S binding protein [Phycisphaerae bacterium]|nr:4Fe-4S binding protein [Phycisphaerae bacterium]
MSTMSKDSPRAKEAAGDVQVQVLLCKSCGLCAEYCPHHLLKPATEIPPDQRTGPVMNPAGHVVYEVYDPEGLCTGCGICGNICPEGAVVVYRRRKAGPSPLPPPPAGEGNGSKKGKEADNG